MPDAACANKSRRRSMERRSDRFRRSSTRRPPVYMSTSRRYACPRTDDPSDRMKARYTVRTRTSLERAKKCAHRRCQRERFHSNFISIRCMRPVHQVFSIIITSTYGRLAPLHAGSSRPSCQSMSTNTTSAQLPPLPSRLIYSPRFAHDAPKHARSELRYLASGVGGTT